MSAESSFPLVFTKPSEGTAQAVLNAYGLAGSFALLPIEPAKHAVLFD
jgi:hypothetical protein